LFCFVALKKNTHASFPYISSDSEFTGAFCIVSIAIPECVVVSSEMSAGASFALLLSDENGATLVALTAFPQKKDSKALRWKVEG